MGSMALEWLANDVQDTKNFTRNGIGWTGSEREWLFEVGDAVMGREEAEAVIGCRGSSRVLRFGC